MSKKRTSRSVSVQAPNRFGFSGMTLIGVVGLVVGTIFLVAGWPQVWHKISTGAEWMSTIFQSK